MAETMRQLILGRKPRGKCLKKSRKQRRSHPMVSVKFCFVSTFWISALMNWWIVRWLQMSTLRAGRNAAYSVIPSVLAVLRFCCPEMRKTFRMICSYSFTWKTRLMNGKTLMRKNRAGTRKRQSWQTAIQRPGKLIISNMRNMFRISTCIRSRRTITANSAGKISKSRMRTVRSKMFWPLPGRRWSWKIRDLLSIAPIYKVPMKSCRMILNTQVSWQQPTAVIMKKYITLYMDPHWSRRM